jgi:hypothetical protein
LFQDTFLTVLLKLPPTATFSDVRVESLTDELGDYLPTINGSTTNGTSVNPMSISNIAQVTDIFPTYELQDRQYIRSMWHMANLVQRTVCTPRSLGSPIIRSSVDKTHLVNEYHQLLESFPPLLTTSEDGAIQDLASNLRLLRQNLFLRSNYWHCVMIIQADEYGGGGVSCDIRGALEAARNALLAFFHFWEYLRVDAGVWWVFQHRAFEEAVSMPRPIRTPSFPYVCMQLTSIASHGTDPPYPGETPFSRRHRHESRERPPPHSRERRREALSGHPGHGQCARGAEDEDGCAKDGVG